MPEDQWGGQAAASDDQRLGLIEEALAEISQGVLIVDAEGRIAFANKRYKRFFELMDHEVEPGTRLLDILTLLAHRGAYGPGDVDEQVRERMEPFTQRENWSLERQVRDGQYLNITGSPLPGGGYVLTFTDITERRRRNEHLEKVVEERTTALREAIDRLHELATSDPLTGALNRRRFDEVHTEEEARARRYGAPYAIAVLDIDHFKQVNDENGHPAGDDVLIELVARLKERLRETDRLARFGGEEFVLLFPDTTLTEAQLLAEDIRQLVESRAFTSADLRLPITISIGVAQWRATVEDRDQVIQAADSALYQAKQNGRNRVEIAETIAGENTEL